MPVPGDLIWIQKAAMDYGRSRAWLDDQIDQGNLKKYMLPGDRRIYLSIAELEAFLAPRQGNSRKNHPSAQDDKGQSDKK